VVNIFFIVGLFINKASGMEMQVVGKHDLVKEKEKSTH